MRRSVLAVPILFLLVASGCREQRATQYYYPADLKNRSLPTWNPTNQLPVSPNAAVSVAIEYVTRKSGTSQWQVDNIELSPIEWADPVTWEYSIRLSQESPRALKIVRVLLDGKVWEPENKERQ